MSVRIDADADNSNSPAVDDDVPEAAEITLNDETLSEASTEIDGVEEGNSTEIPLTSDTEPRDRSGDRLLARLGFLDDAEPLFGSEKNIPNLGFLLAVPFILTTDILSVFKNIYGNIGPAFYGLRTIVMIFLFMTLVRIKNPERSKQHELVGMGQVLGLDRLPEMKTLRRKLKELAARGQGPELMRELGRRRLEEREDIIGYLYVDGFVREYTGKEKIAKGYKPQRRLSVPATTDNWINDKNGDPVFLLTSEINQGLTTVLPEIVKEIQEVVGEGRRFTIIFDRGGWSPRLFDKLKEHCDIMTYRKGKKFELKEEWFYQANGDVDGDKIEYTLNDCSCYIDFRHPDKSVGCLKIRQVTRLRDDGRQTQVLTTRHDISSIEILYHMFNRWRQENYFRYTREEFALDRICEYSVEDVSDDLTHPNPERRKLEKKMKPLRDKILKLEAKVTEITEKICYLEQEKEKSKRPKKEASKIKRQAKRLSKVRSELKKKRNVLLALISKRNSLPERVACKESYKRLKPERKLVYDAIKMVAYQVETAMYRTLAGYYKRCDKDGRELIVAALQSSGDLVVTNDELRVIINPLSCPRWSRALAIICAEINDMGARFPGTNLALRYEVRGY